MKKTLLFILILYIIFSLASCCTKMGCLGAYYKEIIIVFRGASLNSLIKEYDKNSGQLLNSYSISELSAPLNDSIAKIGFQFTHMDSFYLNQRFFVINSPLETDTISNINYQSTHHTIICNRCPGDNQQITDIVNFSYTFKGHTYSDKDTIFISQ